MTASAANDDFEPAARVHLSQGLRLNYFDWGNQGAPLLLLVHGIRDHARSWDWVARALRHDWHVIAPDLRGHGDSAWSPDGGYLGSYHVLDIADLVETLVGEPGGQGPLTIIGHSFGGNVVARYCAAYPDRVRKLVLVEGLGPSPNVQAEWAALGPAARTRDWIDKRRATAAAPPRRMATLAEAVQRMQAANPHLSEAQASHLARHGARRHADGYGWKYDPLVSIFPPEDFSALGPAVWQAIAAPALLCYGTESWTTDPEKDGRASHFRDRRSLAFEMAGHWLHHDQFDAFMAALRDFL
ncbi:alpha/beta hydrolase [Phenylobacterium sp. LjRoot225]|uniref:alpha/beta fold hydrolase n=1 Tax=Phenylobacterium sp. LjRoot225 TaxID=3342285 RepID=UPI003ED078C2